MALLGLGIILLLCKWLEVGWPANWSWWVVLAPFGLAGTTNLLKVETV